MPSRTEAAVLARQLAADIADAVDADQWAIAVVGLKGTGAPDFEELVPRQWLESLNEGRPARYRITLVLQAGGRDLGILRLGTLRPSGFSDEQIVRARVDAAKAAVTLAEVMSAGEIQSRNDAPSDRDYPQGVVILDVDRNICVVSPTGERVLGWHSPDVAGKPCVSVFDCRDDEGRSHCNQCGLAEALARQEIIPSTRMLMADPSGQRRAIRASFWYLPPAGRIPEPRTMLVVRPDDSPDSPAS
jgi:PAS domain-containing protein